jgi:hypothetical protein
MQLYEIDNDVVSHKNLLKEMEDFVNVRKKNVQSSISHDLLCNQNDYILHLVGQADAFEIVLNKIKKMLNDGMRRC